MTYWTLIFVLATAAGPSEHVERRLVSELACITRIQLLLERHRDRLIEAQCLKE